MINIHLNDSPTEIMDKLKEIASRNYINYHLRNPKSTYITDANLSMIKMVKSGDNQIRGYIDKTITEVFNNLSLEEASILLGLSIIYDKERITLHKSIGAFNKIIKQIVGYDNKRADALFYFVSYYYKTILLIYPTLLRSRKLRNLLQIIVS